MPVALLPERITIRPLGPADLEMLCAVSEGLFDSSVDQGHAAAFLADPGHVVVLALGGDLAVGMCSGTIIRHPDKAPWLFLNELGTRDSHVRRGIATALVHAMLDLARTRGCTDVWLGTDPDNAAALCLYRRFRGAEEAAVAGFTLGALSRQG